MIRQLVFFFIGGFFSLSLFSQSQAELPTPKIKNYYAVFEKDRCFKLHAVQYDQHLSFIRAESLVQIGAISRNIVRAFRGKRASEPHFTYFPTHIENVYEKEFGASQSGISPLMLTAQRPLKEGEEPGFWHDSDAYAVSQDAAATIRLGPKKVRGYYFDKTLGALERALKIGSPVGFYTEENNSVYLSRKSWEGDLSLPLRRDIAPSLREKNRYLVYGDDWRGVDSGVVRANLLGNSKPQYILGDLCECPAGLERYYFADYYVPKTNLILNQNPESEFLKDTLPSQKIIETKFRFALKELSRELFLRKVIQEAQVEEIELHLIEAAPFVSELEYQLEEHVLRSKNDALEISRDASDRVLLTIPVIWNPVQRKLIYPDFSKVLYR